MNTGAMALLQRHGITDRDGDGKFFEVYPAGSLNCWKLPSRGYKKTTADCASLRVEILGALRERLPWLTVPDIYRESSDSLDALIAALTVRAATQGLTATPKPDQLEAAKSEGWIHLPTDWARDFNCGSAFRKNAAKECSQRFEDTLRENRQHRRRREMVIGS